MDFTFIEYFLIILTASFIIFTLGIKNELNEKIIKFKEYLLKQTPKGILESANKRYSKETTKQILDSLHLQINIYQNGLKNVTKYIFHSFYCIFFLSSMGVLITLFFDFDVFGMEGNTSSFIQGWLIPIMAILLLYFVTRGIFFLVCYTKIDDVQYLNKIRNRIVGAIELDMDTILGRTTYVPMGKFKIGVLKCLFFLFLPFNEQFTRFFYTFYQT